MRSDQFRAHHHDELSRPPPDVVQAGLSYRTAQNATCVCEASERLPTEHLMRSLAQPPQFLDDVNVSPITPAQCQTSWDNVAPYWNNRFVQPYSQHHFSNMALRQQGEPALTTPTWQSHDQIPPNPTSASLKMYDQPYILSYQHHAIQSPREPRSYLPYTAQQAIPDLIRMSESPSPKLEGEHAVAPADTSTNYRQRSHAITQANNSFSELTEIDAEDQSAEEPYAKLIHRALMSTSNRSMALQDIYEWFRHNTNKGSSSSKGWMNSIRHNLSMNAAFRKTERKALVDEGKKSTEWILEDFAIKDGVQSTTRYRKGTAMKRSGRSDRPDPSRQSSGRKGGISANRTKVQRQRHRDERDVRRPTSRYDVDPLTQFVQQSQNAQQYLSSPLTPPALDDVMDGPYYVPKMESFESPAEYRFEDLSGFYHDDLPLFTGHGLPLDNTQKYPDQQFLP